MHITLLQENLLKVTQTAVRFTASRPQIPILTGIALRASNGKLTIQSTDLRVGFQTTIPVKITDEGEVVVPAKIFSEFLHSLTPGPVELKTDKETILISQNKIKVKLPSFSITEFPPFPEDSQSSFTLPVSQFVSCIDHTLYAASLDETRPVLASLLFQYENGELTCVCTDGYRLSVMKEKNEDTSSIPARVLLPARALQEVMSILAHSNTKTIQLSVSQELSQVFVTIGENTILLRMVEGDFPPYERIIPQSFAFETTLNREEWIAALKTAMVFARESSSILALEFTDGACRILSAGVSAGEHEGSISSSGKTSEPRKISFNGKFLLDVLTHLEDSTIVFKMTDELKPGLLLPEGKEYPLSVIMPFKR